MVCKLCTLHTLHPPQSPPCDLLSLNKCSISLIQKLPYMTTWWLGLLQKRDCGCRLIPCPRSSSHNWTQACWLNCCCFDSVLHVWNLSVQHYTQYSITESLFLLSESLLHQGSYSHLLHKGVDRFDLFQQKQGFNCFGFGTTNCLTVICIADVLNHERMLCFNQTPSKLHWKYVCMTSCHLTYLWETNTQCVHKMQNTLQTAVCKQLQS